MDQLYQHTWVQLLIAWGTGPLSVAIIGVLQWWRDRKDRLSREVFDQKREQRTDEDAREAALDDSFHRLTKDQQDFIANLRLDRDTLQKRNDELEAENRRIHETIWRLILHDKDMRNAAITARLLSDQQSRRLHETPHLWTDLSEWK